MNHKKLLLTLTLCLCALLCMVVTASASEVQGHSHFLCGGNSCTAPTVHQGDVQTEFTQKLTSDNGILKIDDVAANKDTSDIGYELKEGSYYLGNDISLDDGLCITGNVTLCLNGHDIVTVGNVVQIQDDNNFTLCVCKGNKAGYGKFTSNDGGHAVSFGGSKPGTFTMYGGIITGGNVTGNSGGGVFVGSKSTFTMYGGTITGNSARYTGGGVVVYGTFNMYGGAITGNQAREKGGGVMVNGGTFNMCGGSITGNNSQYNFGDYGGGGVYVDSSATITLSGSVQIKDNYKGSNSNKKPSNIYLARNKTITVAGSLTGSSIGVTTAAEPGTGSNVTFANGNANTITTGIFTPDTAGVLVGVAADGTSAYLYKCSHVYEWAYDEEYHWKKCTNVGCDSVEAGSKIAHTWDYPADYNNPKTCVCGATQGEPLTRSYYYYAPSAAEDKKDSPKTADPGVLLYAGLALASLTGLACTAKKRH